MTTLGDRMDNVENAVALMVPMLQRMLDRQESFETSLGMVVETQREMLTVQREMLTTQREMRDTQREILETQGRMLEMLAAIIEKLNEHSSDMTLIKNYIS